MFQLNFSLTTAEERTNFIQQHSLTNLSPSELELCANYILYGKDAAGKSEVDKKNIFIPTKYSSYAKKAPESLDALMENPNFDEGILYRNPVQYKKIKPTIDRDKDSDIPTMKEMWEGIDELQHILDVNMGKDEDSKVKKLTQTQIYKLKHTLIDIRRGQYYLKDIFKPTALPAKNKVDYIPMDGEDEINWCGENENFGFAPLGLYGWSGVGKDIFENVRDILYAPPRYNSKAKFVIDFRNPKHIYELMQHYEDLAIAAIDKPDSLMGLIVRTLDWYCAHANLKGQHWLIMAMKKKKLGNKSIQMRVNKEFKTTHTENYISTIWTQKICGEIAAAAKLHDDKFIWRDDDVMWKRCNTCKQWKLRDSREFVKKTKASDGFSGRCKECDKRMREGLRLTDEILWDRKI